MIPGLQPVPLSQLKAHLGAKRWIIDGFLDDLESLTPVKGEVSAEHKGNFLLVKGKAYTLVILRCDRCLCDFKTNLDFNCEEIISLNENENNNRQRREDRKSREIDSFVESIDPYANFEPERWIFEQLSLNIPISKSCSNECLEAYSSKYNDLNKLKTEKNNIDPRWNKLNEIRNL